MRWVRLVLALELGSLGDLAVREAGLGLGCNMDAGGQILHVKISLPRGSQIMIKLVDAAINKMRPTLRQRVYRGNDGKRQKLTHKSKEIRGACYNE